MQVQIRRIYSPGGTNGHLYVNGRFHGFTIELPWLNNQHRISCIPEGKYLLKKRYSERHGRHLEVTGVPGRDLVLIHPANDAVKELLGCIAPVRYLTGEGKGSGSRVATEDLYHDVFDVLGKEEVDLVVSKG